MLFLTHLLAQERTLGVTFNSGHAYPGYTLFSPAVNNNVYLIDNCGGLVHEWRTERRPGNSVYLSDDGYLYRAGQVDNDFIIAGGAGGIIEKFDWDGNVVWNYVYSSEFFRAHHDFQVMPNGNILILAWESFTKDEALALGRNPNLLIAETIWPEHIIEVEPSGVNGGTIVWEWHAWDHMIQDFDSEKQNFGVVADHPEKIDINHVREGRILEDWMHANSINYNADLDQIMLSVLFFDEIWIIDHNTTTEEARREKGDLLFRWGNPQAYHQGGPEDQKLFGQHNAKWIAPGLPDAGKILIFNNGQERFEDASQLFTEVVKLNPESHYQKDQNGRFLPEDFDWVYRKHPPTDFYSRYISGAQQLPNGHILVDDGAHGTFFEINEANEIVWEYVNPITNLGILSQGETIEEGSLNIVFRAEKYGLNHPAFDGKILEATTTIELESDFDCGPLLAANIISPNVYPNPARDYIVLDSFNGELRLVDLNGRVRFRGFVSENSQVNISHLNTGLYLVYADGEFLTKVMVR